MLVESMKNFDSQTSYDPLLMTSVKLSKTLFSKEIKYQHEEFNQWLSDLFLEENNPYIFTILTLKHLLNRYFSDQSNMMSDQLRKISVQEIEKIFALKKNYLEKKFNSSKNMKSSGQEEEIKSLFSECNSEDKKMAETYLKLNKCPIGQDLVDKMAAINGYLLKILIRAVDLEKIKLDFFKEMNSQKNIKGFYGFKFRVIQVIFGFGYKIQNSNFQNKNLKNSQNRFLDEEFKNKLIKSMRRINYATRIKFAGQVLKNMVFNLALNGKVFEANRCQMEARMKGENLDLFNVESYVDMDYSGESIGRDADFSFISEKDFFNSDFDLEFELSGGGFNF